MDEVIRDKFETVLELKLRIQRLQIVRDLRILQRDVLKAEDTPDRHKAIQYDILSRAIAIVSAEEKGEENEEKASVAV